MSDKQQILPDQISVEGSANGYVLASNGSVTYWTAVSGALGYTGSQGSIGYTGSKGDAGAFGFTGSVGTTGYTGSQGELGYSGSAGFVGSAGYTGSQGDQGTTGYAGSKGDLGYSGSIGFTGSSGVVAGSNNQILYKDASNTLTGSVGLRYDGVSLKVNGNLESVYSNGDEGGEIFLEKPVTNSTLAAGITIDVYQNKLRFFENGGTNRGAYIDFTSANTGVGSNLLAGGGGGGGTGFTGSAGSTGFTGSAGAGFTGSAGASATANVSSQAFTANGTQTTFDLIATVAFQNNTIVTVNGLVLTPITDYTIASSTLTLTFTPQNGDDVVVRNISDVITSGLGYTGSAGTNGFTGSSGSSTAVVYTYSIILGRG